IPIEVKIIKRDDFNPFYEVIIPGIAEYTRIILETSLRAELISEVNIDITEILDPKKADDVKKKFFQGALVVLQRNFPSLTEEKQKVLASYLLQNTLGLGEIESLVSDERLEEIVINNAREPIWVYHKKYGWCKTNLTLKDEETTFDYSSLIARKVGRQINTLNPLLDAHLPNGDRVNSTLFPISNFGNTLTIRKFSRNPWSITTLIKNQTLSPDVGALIWLAVQNELSLVVAGGTGSGKTSFLNALAGLIPANQRIISIEDTRELTLPSFLQWVPLVTREPNPEGKGAVSMLDLMVNSLRMRPDRIIVGEIRRQREAEILFEAMHTGHSVYSTLHADNVEQAISRITNPPINIPREMLDALAGIVVTFRHRRFNIRRVLEFGEVLKNGQYNVVYRWDVKNDEIKQVAGLSRLVDLIGLYAGMSEKEIEADLDKKSEILNWMVTNDYLNVDQVGKIVSNYYMNEDQVYEAASSNKKWKF
ncbi:type II/IV secretion system ATPase subunit, partial [Candidatus Micrarchaeota archaeon]|nr:type II/IV secretion system ATPase subunit [Candidatus Micrarchaeota archaeon]